jgi:hypothetical protein
MRDPLMGRLRDAFRESTRCSCGYCTRILIAARDLVRHASQACRGPRYAPR